MPVGSVPLTDPAAACDLIFRHFPDVPGWPQLPRRGWRELMVNQFLEGVPDIKFDNARERAVWNESLPLPSGERVGVRGGSEGVRGQVGPDFAAGLHQFLADCRAGRAASAEFVKGQVVGPVTLAWNLRDSAGESVIKRPGALDWSARIVAAKARWQIRALREASGKPVVLVVDEPTLAVFKSPLLDIPRDAVSAALGSVAAVIRAEGATVGLHCCGRTDWTLVLGCGFDLVNFDAYEFFEGVLPHAAAFARFVQAGGRIAWGIVPTTPKIHDETAARLVARWRGQVDALAQAAGSDRRDADRRAFPGPPAGLKAPPIPGPSEEIWLTPSCGVGGLPEDWAERVFTLTAELAKRLGGTIQA